MAVYTVNQRYTKLMNRTLLVFIVVLILAGIGIGAYFWTHLPGPATTQNTGSFPPPTQAEQSPADFTRSFYAWYVTSLANGTLNTAAYTQELPRLLTPEFAANLDTITESTDGDPITLAQDYYPSWLTNITATILTQNSSAAQVRVSLGTGSELHVLDVTLMKMNGAWKIASVAAGA
jgi:hypothetical protein